MSFLSTFVSAIVTPFRILATWFTKLIPGFKRLASLSLAARVAWMTFLFLLIVLGAGVIKYLMMPVDVRSERDWWLYLSLAFGLMIPITIAVYWLTRLLQQKPVAEQPDLEQAWNFGVEALAQQNIPLRRVPLFIILGVRNGRQVRELMKAVQFDAQVMPPDHQDMPLLWYGNQQAVFLFMPGAGCLSAVTRGQGATPVAASLTAMSPAHADAGRTLGADGDAMGLGMPLAPAAPVAQKTLGANDNQPTSPSSGARMGAAPASLAAMGTLNSDTPLSPLDQPEAIRTVAATPTKISEDELNLQSRRVQFVCGLLRAARRPICPLNGVMVVTPFELIESGSPHTRSALQADLHVLRDRLAVRCPATLLVSDMQDVDGFMELVKRFGIDDAVERRLGKGCEAWADPSMNRLDAVAAHAVGAFEDLIYLLFKNPDTLRRRYNGKLVALLCRTRGKFAEHLRAFVRHGFGYDPQISPDLAEDQMLFSGCYFAATGFDDDHRAFTKAVFAKLIEQQGQLEWAPKARREDQLLHGWANFLALVGMIALLAVVAGIVLLFRG